MTQNSLRDALGPSVVIVGLVLLCVSKSKAETPSGQPQPLGGPVWYYGIMVNGDAIIMDEERLVLEPLYQPLLS